jgi:hypothetical protein
LAQGARRAAGTGRPVGLVADRPVAPPFAATAVERVTHLPRRIHGGSKVYVERHGYASGVAAPIRAVPQPAPWLAQLPSTTMGNGTAALVPAESDWQDARPQLSETWPTVTFLLGASGACSVCGTPFAANEIRWRAFSSDDTAIVRREVAARRAFVERLAPGHKSCMLYSVMICPYWARSSARIRPRNPRGGRSQRGPTPTLQGFTEVEVLLPRGVQNRHEHAHFYYGGWAAEAAFDDPAVLAGHYTAAVAAEHSLRQLDNPLLFRKPDSEPSAEEQAIALRRRITSTAPSRTVLYEYLGAQLLFGAYAATADLRSGS